MAYAARSGITTVENLMVPLYIAHGETDVRVPSEHAVRYMEKAQELGISESVVFHGNVSNVVDKVATSDIYISSSDYEGISNSMLEALAMGVPSICTDCAGGGARLAIENDVNGLLVRCGDTDNFADAMARIADNAAFARRMSEAAIESSARFAPSTIYAQWLGALL